MSSSPPTLMSARTPGNLNAFPLPGQQMAKRCLLDSPTMFSVSGLLLHENSLFRFCFNATLHSFVAMRHPHRNSEKTILRLFPMTPIRVRSGLKLNLLPTGVVDQSQVLWPTVYYKEDKFQHSTCHQPLLHEKRGSRPLPQCTMRDFDASPTWSTSFISWGRDISEKIQTSRN